MSLFKRKKVRNDPELCRQISEIVGGPEGAKLALENMLGKELAGELIAAQTKKGRRK